MLAVGAIAGALVAWIAYAALAVRPDAHLVRSRDIPSFLGLVAAAGLLDAVAAIRIASGRSGNGVIAWLAVRALLSAAGFLFVTLPSYAVAVLVLTTGRTTDGADPTTPHPYRPTSRNWYSDLTPLWWSRNLMGASQLGARACAICHEAADARIHAPSDEES